MSVFIDQEAEQSALATALLSETSLDTMLAAGLRPFHFYWQSHGEIFGAMTAVHETGRTLDVVTLRIELERLYGWDRERASVDSAVFSQVIPMSSTGVEYAERVVEMASKRSMQAALHEAQAALSKGDRAELSRALDKMNRAGEERRRDSLSPEMWGATILEYLNAPKESGFIPLPFPSLTRAMGGGILPGELMLISGFTAHGKSIVADQLLDEAAKHGLRAHLYMTEMTAAQRGLRLVSRRTGVPYGTLRSRALTDEQKELVVKELEAVPFGVSVVSDWDIDDVVRDALRARFDLVVIDLIHGFDYDDERGLDRLSKAAQRLARVSTTRGGYLGTAVVIVAHLSGAQMSGGKTAKRPKPGMHSLKGSTSLQQDPDFVMFVWQQDDDEGLPTGEGKVWLPKARSGDNETVDVRLNPRYLRFEVAEDRF